MGPFTFGFFPINMCSIINIFFLVIFTFFRAYVIVGIQYVKHNIHCLFIRLLGNSGLLVVKLWGSQKLQADFQLLRFGTPNPVLFKGQL